MQRQRPRLPSTSGEARRGGRHHALIGGRHTTSVDQATHPWPLARVVGVLVGSYSDACQRRGPQMGGVVARAWTIRESAMKHLTRSRSVIRHVLRRASTIAIIGASPSPERHSHAVARYLTHAGYDVIPVRPGHTGVAGLPTYARLADIPGAVDLVIVFRTPSAAFPHMWRRRPPKGPRRSGCLPVRGARPPTWRHSSVV
jgi:hypothetical protein